MTDQKIQLVVPEENHLERIDKFLSAALEADFSRSYIQKLIRNENILVNDLSIKQNYKIKCDDEIEIIIPEPEILDVIPQEIPLNFIFQDSSVAVINKQPGLVVHPGPGNWDKTLVNALMYHVKDLSSIGGKVRPGIVHRLDKDTTGLMIIAKNDKSHAGLVDQFSNREVKKGYSAIVVGKPGEGKGIIEKPIKRHKKYRHKMTIDENGRDAITEYMVKKIWHTRSGVYSLLDIKIHTGRTHQIRVHLSSMGNPIVGDPIYSKKWEKHRVPFLLLASMKLNFKHPEKDETLDFEIEMPEHFKDFINRIEKLLLV